MSGKSQLDLLVRVRYSNPLPPPPYPPKLLHIPTDPKRYARVEFTQPLSNETPLPMVVDADCGMPLDLCNFDFLWDGSENTDGVDPRPIDQKDEFMLESSTGASSSAMNGINVSWLRKTEYISREAPSSSRPNASQSLEMKTLNDIPVDISLEAQISTIEQTFPAVDQPIDITTLRHPNKPDVHAVDVYEILPDPDLWPSNYDIIRFAERPGERPLEESDPRLDMGLLRPQESSDGDHFLSYYLPKEDDEAEEYQARRRARDEDPDKPPIAFQFVRDYETARIEQNITNEYFLILDDVDRPDRGTHEVKGAYYATISRKIHLRKKRAVRNEEPPQNKIDIYQVSHIPFTAEEEAERIETTNEITDPGWLARAKLAHEKMEADAEGEMEEEPLQQTNGVHHDDMEED